MGDDVRDIVIQWVEYLKNDQLMGNGVPLFPKTKMCQDSDNGFQVAGLTGEHWSRSTDAIRKIFKNTFSLAELPNFNPHSFRNTLVRLAEKFCQNPEDFKAWSQNLGHEGVLTTFYSYGEVQLQRQAEIIQNLNETGEQNELNAENVAEALFRKMNAQGIKL